MNFVQALGALFSFDHGTCDILLRQNGQTFGIVWGKRDHYIGTDFRLLKYLAMFTGWELIALLTIVSACTRDSAILKTNTGVVLGRTGLLMCAVPAAILGGWAIWTQCAALTEWVSACHTVLSR